jgi:hypothetical protein
MQREVHPHDHTTHGHDVGPAAQAVHDPVVHGTESTPAAHTTHARTIRPPVMTSTPVTRRRCSGSVSG